MRISDWSSDVCSSDLFVRSQQIDIRVPAEGDAGILGAVNILFVDRRDQVQRSDFLQRQAVTVLFDVDRILVNLLERVRRVGEESKDRLLEAVRSEEHTSELQSLMRISYAVFCLKKKTINKSQKYMTYTTYTIHIKMNP